MHRGKRKTMDKLKRDLEALSKQYDILEDYCDKLEQHLKRDKSKKIVVKNIAITSTGDYECDCDCPECGTTLENIWQFCPWCGQRLDWDIDN